MYPSVQTTNVTLELLYFRAERSLEISQSDGLIFRLHNRVREVNVLDVLIFLNTEQHPESEIKASN